MTLICVIVSKRVLSIVRQFYRLAISCTKSTFPYTFYRPNEKTAKVWCFALASSFYIIFIDGLSMWTYPFIIIYLNIIQFFHLINSKNILGKILCYNCILVLNNASISLVENEPQDFLQKNVVLKVPFLLYQMLFLISRINRCYTRGYYFYRWTLRSEKTFGKWNPFKNEEKYFLFRLKSSFRFQGN